MNRFILPGMIVAALVIAGCGKTAPPAMKPAIPVKVTVATLRDLPQRQRAIGFVEASAEAVIRSLVTAPLLTVHFKEGDEIAQGTVLFTLDDREFAAAVAEAEAVLAKNQAQATYATLDAERSERLAQSGQIATQQAEQARAARDAAVAAVAADRAALVRAKLDQERCTITAPIAGRIGMLGITPGNLAVAQQTALTSVVCMAPIYIRTTLPARLLPLLRAATAGIAVEITPEDGSPSATSGWSAAGRIDLIDNRIDSDSATIRLRAVSDNRNRRLWPGQQCRVELRLGSSDPVLAVPGAAVQIGQKGPLVWVVGPERTALPTPVTVLRVQDGFAVIGSGLAVGETVVTDGQVRLTRGAAVKLAETAQAVPARAGGR